jgi:hypothetical protein
MFVAAAAAAIIISVPVKQPHRDSICWYIFFFGSAIKLLQLKTSAGIYVICDWRTEFSFLSVIY